MEIKCNNTKYKIIEKEKLCSEEDVGYADYQNKQIMLKKLDKDFMIKTLKHELMHIWLYEYGHNQEEKAFSDEDICEIVASSNDFINEAIEQYLNIEETKIYVDDSIYETINNQKAVVLD